MTHGDACATILAGQPNRERAVIADEDRALVSRFLRGDASAFDTLFSRYQDYVYHILYGVLGNTEEARDLTQEVFLQVYRSLPKFRNSSRFATWLYRIALNRAVDATRSAKRRAFFPLFAEPEHKFNSELAPDEEMSEEPEAIFLAGEARHEIQQVLMQCPVAHRQPLVLRYYRDLSLEEMAEVMECTVTAAKVRLHRARKVFRDYYEKRQREVTNETSQEGKETSHVTPTLR